jgi:hypothetical protein
VSVKDLSPSGSDIVPLADPLADVAFGNAAFIVPEAVP